MEFLEGPLLKLSRAREQLESFKGAVQTFAESSPVHTRTQSNADITEGWLTYDSDSPFAPPQLGVQLGEIAYQLRSALDQLLWQVSYRRNPSIPDSTHLYFPIRRTPPKQDLEGLIHLDTAQRQRIVALQPYNRTSADPVRDPLWVVSNMNIADKHLTVPLLLTPTFVRGGRIRTTDWMLPTSGQFPVGSLWNAARNSSGSRSSTSLAPIH